MKCNLIRFNWNFIKMSYNKLCTTLIELFYQVIVAIHALHVNLYAMSFLRNFISRYHYVDIYNIILRLKYDNRLNQIKYFSTISSMVTPRVHMCLLSLLYFFCKITPRCMLPSFVKDLFWWHSTDTQNLPWSFSHTWNVYATKYNLAWEYWASCNLIPCGGFLTCFNVLYSPYGVYYLYMSPSVFQSL